MDIAFAALVIFRLAEIGQDLVIGPAAAAHLSPGVEILDLSAHIDHAIDRTGPAEHLAAWQEIFFAVIVFFGFGFQAPVHVRVIHILAVAQRNVDPEILVFRPRFQQQNLVWRDWRSSRLANHAAGGAGADNDDIIIFHP